MTTIVPTVTEEAAEGFNNRVELLSQFADRLHLDFSDGEFSPRRLMNIIQASWPETVTVDFHLMLKRPADEIQTVISLKPNLVIVHAESDGDLLALLDDLKTAGIRTGVAFLPETDPAEHAELVTVAEYALIFAGKLGFQGGELNRDMIEKVRVIRNINADIQVAWDGGVNPNNARWLADNGVDTLNVGGAIVHQPNPKQAYQELVDAVR